VHLGPADNCYRLPRDCTEPTTTTISTPGYARISGNIETSENPRSSRRPRPTSLSTDLLHLVRGQAAATEITVITGIYESSREAHRRANYRRSRCTFRRHPRSVSSLAQLWTGQPGRIAIAVANRRRGTKNRIESNRFRSRGKFSKKGNNPRFLKK